MRDETVAGRAVQWHLKPLLQKPRGYRGCGRRLHRLDVAEMRRWYADEHPSTRTMAAFYRVSYQTARDILRNMTWVEPLH